jgi:putative ABC transport system permease protein
MSAGLMGWRPLARLAWREVVRRKGRTALVVTMVAVPMMMLTALSVWIRTDTVTGARANQLLLGPTVDVRVSPGPGFGLGAQAMPFNPTATESFGPILPAGATSVVVKTWYQGLFVSPQAKLGLQISQSDWGNPLLAHNFVLRSGAWPKSPGEAAVTGEVHTKARVNVGDTINLRVPKMTVKVTGVFERRDQLRNSELALAPTEVFNALPSAQNESYVDLGPAATQVDVANFLLAQTAWRSSNPYYDQVSVDDGVARLTSYRQPSTSPLTIMNVGFSVLLFLLGIIVAAVFAVGARRQLRQLGLVAANGGDPRQVGRVITLQGTAAALIGSVLGIAGGVLLVTATASYWNTWHGAIIPGIVVQPLDWLLGGSIALLAGTIAAGMAARQARRVPTLSALAGRRPLPAITARFPIIGAAIVGLGLFILSAGISYRQTQSGGGPSPDPWIWLSLGSVLVIFGGVLCAPYLVGRLDPLAGRLSGALRLAARRTARHRARSGPLVGAIMAAAAAAIAFSAISLSTSEGNRQRYLPRFANNQVEVNGRSSIMYGTPSDRSTPTPETLQQVVSRVQALVPDTKAVQFQNLSRASESLKPNETSRWLTLSDNDQSGYTFRRDALIATSETLRSLGVPENVISKVQSGSVLIAGGGENFSNPLHVEVSTIKADANGQSAVPPTVERLQIDSVRSGDIDLGQRSTGCFSNVRGPCKETRGAVIIMSADSAARLGFEPVVPTTVIVAPRPLTLAQKRSLRDLVGDVNREAEDAATAEGKVFQYGNEPQIGFEFDESFPQSLTQLIVGGAALLLALLVTALALGLAAVDNRGDDATLVALGAAPSVRRKVRAWEGALLSGMGVLLAIPIGFLPSLVVRSVRYARNPIVFPWITVGILLVIVPALAWLIGYASARTPRRVTDLNLQLD